MFPDKPRIKKSPKTGRFVFGFKAADWFWAWRAGAEHAWLTVKKVRSGRREVWYGFIWGATTAEVLEHVGRLREAEAVAARRDEEKRDEIARLMEGGKR